MAEKYNVENQHVPLRCWFLTDVIGFCLIGVYSCAEILIAVNAKNKIESFFHNWVFFCDIFRFRLDFDSLTYSQSDIYDCFPTRFGCCNCDFRCWLGIERKKDI